jgi:hypothetical protein
MGRPALDLDPEPDHPDLGANQLFRGRLGDQAAVGAVAALDGRQRANPGALLLDHRLEVNPRGRTQAGVADRVERIERGDGAGLHVGGAAAVQPAVPHFRRERRRTPHFERPRRHHVAMALQDQRAAAARRRAGDRRRRPVGADHRAGLGEIGLHRPEVAQPLQALQIDRPVVDLVAARPQQVAEHVLAGRLGAPCARYGGEPEGGGDLGVEIGVDRLVDPPLLLGRQGQIPSNSAVER